MVDLISRRTRRAFREALVNRCLAEISELFDGVGVRHVDLPAHRLPSGQRRSLVEGYYASVNWQDPSDIGRIFDVYQAVLADLPVDNQLRLALIENLRGDGWYYDDGKIIPLSLAPTRDSPTEVARAPALGEKPCPVHPTCPEAVEIERDYSDQKVFVAIPYTEYAYEDAIRKTIQEAGLIAVLAKDRIESTALLCKVCKTFRKCRYGVADITGGNLNVIYELGMMQALGMRCAILLAESGTRQTDLQGIENVTYKIKPAHLQLRLAAWIQDNVVGIDSGQLDAFIQGLKLTVAE